MASTAAPRDDRFAAVTDNLTVGGFSFICAGQRGLWVVCVSVVVGSRWLVVLRGVGRCPGPMDGRPPTRRFHGAVSVVGVGDSPCQGHVGMPVPRSKRRGSGVWNREMDSPAAAPRPSSSDGGVRALTNSVRPLAAAESELSATAAAEPITQNKES